MILWIFSPKTSPSAPPNTVKSWAKMHTWTAVDRTRARDDAVGVGTLFDPGVVRPMAGEHVELLERTRVEQVLDALAGEHLALLVLALNRALGRRMQGFVAAPFEIVEAFLHRMGGHNEIDATCQARAIGSITPVSTR